MRQQIFRKTLAKAVADKKQRRPSRIGTKGAYKHREKSPIAWLRGS